MLSGDFEWHDDLFDRGALDEDWVPQVAAMGMTVLTRDKSMHEYPAGQEALARSGAVVICNSDGGCLNAWDFVVLLLRRWQAIQGVAEAREPGLYFYTAVRNPYLVFGPPQAAENAPA